MIHQVELVNLPQERVQQPKVVSEERPKPVEQKPKVEKSVSLKIKKETKAHKLVEKKKPVMQEKVVAEEPTVPKEPMKTEQDQVKEAVNTVPGLPEIMPILQKPYTEYEFYHALIGREIRKRWSPPPVSLEGQRMETVVAFSISRSGRINGEVRLEKSSGNLFYDQAALRATMGPLPPPPPGYPEELLKMRLIYVLDQSVLN
jgi:TonB family protein